MTVADTTPVRAPAPAPDPVPALPGREGTGGELFDAFSTSDTSTTESEDNTVV